MTTIRGYGQIWIPDPPTPITTTWPPSTTNTNIHYIILMVVELVIEVDLEILSVPILILDHHHPIPPDTMGGGDEISV